MAGIYVLSDSLKSGNKVGKPTTRGDKATDSPEDAAAAFADILGNSLNLSTDPKGQSSKASKHVSGKKGLESPGDSAATQQSTDDSSDKVLGYGNFALPFLTQLLQSNFPAGKEANFGSIGQGTGKALTSDALKANSGGILSGSNQNLTMPGEVPLTADGDLASTGMLAAKTQGSELDNYRQVISELLEVLSGEIKSSGGTSSSLARVTQLLSQSAAQDSDSKEILAVKQDIANKIINFNSQESYSGTVTSAGASSQNIIKDVQGDKALELLAQLTNEITDGSAQEDSITREKKILSLSRELTNLVQTWKTSETSQTSGVLQSSQVSQSSGNSQSSEVSQSSEELQSAKTSQSSETAKTAETLKTAASDANAGSGISADVRGSKPAPDVQDQRVEGLNAAPTAPKSSDVSLKRTKENSFEPIAAQAKDTKLFTTIRPKSEITENQSPRSAESHTEVATLGQNSSNTLGVTANSEPVNVASGKTGGVPVWEQVSSVLREQLTNRQQDLKELDIQLHPAELGKIHINLRWDNGLVHLEVQASQADTRQGLQSHLSDLRHSLTEQGVSCGTLNMGMDGEQRQNQRGDAPRQMIPWNVVSNEDEDSLSTIANSPPLEQKGSSQIDVTA
ncbi:flagellar hook-length control protein FliK [Desulfosporosinus sp. PR]|uniref:flagellar hook-length control protein FliK n=1 Tax=Candidatus Desulfosporosinus nitrosoreducens TaxID=3401928 RepID=UPI0027F7D468|nr:flagellar hook-length control protein FliK [Desulfosporosinus sp. PR]MDQ7096214.1 flagellar hook-length control protein FliK [Desulfosporosinus sp. PR]